MNFAGLKFEERIDDSSFESEHAKLLTEESWKNPERFGHIESTFENHIKMIEKRSQELGIKNEYSVELVATMAELDTLYSQMMSYDELYQTMCACPEDFGMTEGFVSKIFGRSDRDQDHDWHPGHDSHDSTKNKEEKKKTKKKKTVSTGWFNLFYGWNSK